MAALAVVLVLKGKSHCNKTCNGFSLLFHSFQQNFRIPTAGHAGIISIHAAVNDFPFHSFFQHFNSFPNRSSLQHSATDGSDSILLRIDQHLCSRIPGRTAAVIHQRAQDSGSGMQGLTPQHLPAVRACLFLSGILQLNQFRHHRHSDFRRGLRPDFKAYRRMKLLKMKFLYPCLHQIIPKSFYFFRTT